MNVRSDESAPIELGIEAEPLVDILIEVEARNAAARERETQTATA